MNNKYNRAGNPTISDSIVTKVTINFYCYCGEIEGKMITFKYVEYDLDKQKA
ncbi:hypothetical protein [Clostridium folliculivorans]|uniref:Uncharacterized protein n=1 Tax=Clostridium folliculivorans TaxID=2886038 RepID=A0A9W5XZA3_9CLOT|nr:hypothetical protein [Clostridium folliculivorans]GKU23680.1 hypothetical protein CFOLD11_05060 [Clostridium folliculivorans]GKU29796.1 hypothetical protein CFB3_19030 [Clostridium folliculivorans]